MNKKFYIKPELKEIVLDNSISLQMKSKPKDPPPRGGKGGSTEPFQSPFGDKPFS